MGRLKKYSYISKYSRKTVLIGATCIILLSIASYFFVIRPAIHRAKFQEYITVNDPLVGSQQVNGFGQIYYDFDNIRTYITRDDHNHINPKSYKQFVTWQEETNGQSQIVLHDLKTKQTVQLSFLRSNTNASIGDSLVAWEGSGGGVATLYYFDGYGVKQASQEHPAIRPSVQGSQILYAQQINQAKDLWQAVLYDTKSNETKVIAEGTASEASWPRFEGDQIKTTIEGSSQYR